jgi:uncharacterized protein YndB with AHSA1/START domain
VQRVDITHDFTKPVPQVYAWLSEHENLGPLFGASVERVRDGHDSRNGTGSVRRLRVAPLPPFEETVVEAVPDERIVYRITKGGILRDHRGTMTFAPHGTGTRLHYVIEFGAVVPGLDRVVKRSLERSIPRALPRVDVHA